MPIGIANNNKYIQYYKHEYNHTDRRTGIVKPVPITTLRDEMVPVEVDDA